jgi:hypothetical protein
MKPSPAKLATLCGAFLLVLFAAATPEDVRAQGTTASLRGTVTDQAGETLPGANVLAVHQPSGTRYGTTTGADGQYELQGMRVGGPYRLTVSFVGYQEATEEGFELSLGQTRTINVQLLQQAQELEPVEVVGQQSSVINTNRTGAQTNVSQQAIETLPSISRSLSDLARLTPQASGRGGNSIAGRNDRYNSIQIDGATFDDVFGLGEAVPGSQAGAQPISLDAIEEFNVNIAPYDVRQSGFTGGQINAITKSGTNDFEGAVRYRRGQESFVGDFQGQEFGNFDENLFVGTLGGPIIEDELFFFVNAEVVRESSPENTAVSDPDAAVTFEGSEDQLTSISEISENVYGYDAGGFETFSERQDNYKFLAKVDWTINDNHRLSVTENYLSADSETGIGRGETSFDLGSRQYTLENSTNTLTAQLRSTFSETFYNEARVVYTRIRDSRNPAGGPFPDVTVNFSGDLSAGLGIGRFNQANQLDQDLYQFTNDLNISLGDHQVTLGTSNYRSRFSNVFIQDFYGTYTFGPYESPAGEQFTGIEAFQQGRPSSYQFSYASEYAFDEQGRLIFNEGNPVRKPSDDLRPPAEFTAYQFGLYAQDEWSATDRLNLTLGLRADVPYLPEEPTENPLVSGTTGVRQGSGETFDVEAAFPGFSTTNTASGFDNLLFSPRFGFNFDATGLATDFSTQIRGGAGVFSGDPPFVFISNQYTNTGADVARLDVGAQEPGFVPGSGENDDRDITDPRDQPRPGESAGLSPIATTEVNLISEDFNYPQTFRADLAVDQELPMGLIATVEGLYSSTISDVVYRNLNLNQIAESGSEIYGIGESQYGRPLYGEPVAGFSGSNNRNKQSEFFTNALLLENTSKGYEYSITAQLQRNLQGESGLSGSLSYTHGRATNANNATSSRAISNWQFNEVKDVNDPRVGTADFQTSHRVLAWGSYRLAYGDGNRFSTSIGLTYDGTSGAPFSYIYFGDANGDGQAFNDLIYVPEDQRDVFVVPTDGSDGRTPDQLWSALDSYIEGEEPLDEARGEVIERNTDVAPWQNILDLSITQGIETFDGQRVEINAVMENVLNAFNNDWGRIQTPGFNNYTLLNFRGYITDDDVGSRQAGRVVTEDDVGKPVVSLRDEEVNERLSEERFAPLDFLSRWRFRLGVRYTF